MVFKIIPTLLCLAGYILNTTHAYKKERPDVISTGHYDFDNADHAFDANGTFIARSYTVNLRANISSPRFDAHLLWLQQVLDDDTEQMLEVRRRNRDVLTDPDDQDYFYIIRPHYYWRVNRVMHFVDYYGVFACARTAFLIYNNPDVATVIENEIPGIPPPPPQFRFNYFGELMGPDASNEDEFKYHSSG